MFTTQRKPLKLSVFRKAILNELKLERKRQDTKWGEQNHDPEWWMQILMEEVGECSKAILESRFSDHQTRSYLEYREEMLQVAAVAIAAIESFDRNMDGK